MSIDSLLARSYDRERYHCLHFAADAWELITGDARLHEVDESDFAGGGMRWIFRLYRRVAGPTVEPSIVLMENVRGEPHIGVCRNRRLLHIGEDGPLNLPFDASTGMYFNFRFYQP